MSIKIADWNITVSFFGKGTIHDWDVRREHVIEFIADFMANGHAICLQELSPEQASEIYDALALSSMNFTMLTLSQAPSEVETGAIAVNGEVANWKGKFVGTALIAIIVKGEVRESGRFWFNPEPHVVPTARDRAETDKGFGNMNTPRAVLWCKAQIDDRTVYLFNSHYPLSGGNDTRRKCAELERAEIAKIVGNHAFVSCGDRNFIPDMGDPDQAFQTLVDGYFCQTNAETFKGNMLNTWMGFSYDKFYNPIANGEFVDNSLLDVVYSNCKIVSASHEQVLYGDLEKREFASDHMAVIVTL